MRLLKLFGTVLAIGLFPWVSIGQADRAQDECSIIVEPEQSIQQTLDKASENAVICLSAGTWEEHLKISKSLTLRGQGAEATILKGSLDGGSSVIEISTEQNTEIVVTLENLSVVDFPWDGVAVQGPVQLTVNQVRLSGNQGCGLDARGFARVHIAKSPILGNGCGILAQESALISVAETEIVKNQHSGIMINHWGESAQLRLTNSRVLENGENGLEIWGPTVAFITDSSISRNGHLGIRSSAVILTIEKTLVSENRGGGFFVEDGRVTLKDSQVSGNHDDGLLLVDNAQLQVIDSRVTANDGWGIAAMVRRCGWDEDLFSGSVTLSGNTTIADNKEDLCLPQEISVQPPLAPACHITLPSERIPQAQKLIDNVLDETVICLPAGEFAVNLKIAKSLTLRGSEEGRTVLRPANPDEPVIVVQASQPISVSLDNLTLTGANRGSFCWPGQCRFTLSIAGEARAQLQRMSIVLGEQGVGVFDNAQVEITGSRLVENAYGLMISGFAQVAVRESHIAYGEMGITAGYYMTGIGLSKVHIERTRIVGMRGCALLISPESRLSGRENEFAENGVDLCGPVPAELRRPLVPQTGRMELVVPRDYPTLQAAIDAIAPGGSILVERGVFAGASIYKDVTIRGAGVDQTVIRGALTVCCEAGQVSLADFSLEWELKQGRRPLEVLGASGLWIFSGKFSNVELERLRIEGGYLGLMIGGLARVQGRHLTVTQNDMGLSVYGLVVVELSDFELSHNTLGMNVGGDSLLILRHSVIAAHEHWAGRIGGDSQLYLSDSVVRDNLSSIVVEGGAFVLVERSVLENNGRPGLSEGALLIKGQARGTVLESRIVGNSTGILAQESSLLNVRRSVFSGNSTALLAEGNATLWAIEESQFIENDDALILNDATQVHKLARNEIRNNHGIGVQAETPDNILECADNIVEGNEGGNYNDSAAQVCAP